MNVFLGDGVTDTSTLNSFGLFLFLHEAFDKLYQDLVEVYVVEDYPLACVSEEVDEDYLFSRDFVFCFEEDVDYYEGDSAYSSCEGYDLG